MLPPFLCHDAQKQSNLKGWRIPAWEANKVPPWAVPWAIAYLMTCLLHKSVTAGSDIWFMHWGRKILWWKNGFEQNKHYLESLLESQMDRRWDFLWSSELYGGWLSPHSPFSWKFWNIPWGIACMTFLAWWISGNFRNLMQKHDIQS